ncbi:MAG: hypothetical protein L0L45_03435 [Bifidobacterium mongoliense]|uniref:hypothetical protein n=1 Tax=Bifidobacterium mongoliense TaxID=518643 RepID=UPI0026487FD2|nr:hypothetical protein [Bifidobacterium mongoliense]MDN6768878.1 hypothetical protein [Bifidobacterium mongoliense]MDN6783481.1 hypothetical protein [Bifidobacterium mongoliense]MDN6802944.1 hypothetical protein [Bifidobacterium mongoliense]
MSDVTTTTVTDVPTPTVTDVPTPSVSTPAVTAASIVQAEPVAESGDAGYTPVFSAAVRTVVYVVCLIVGGLGGAATVVCALTSAPFWLTAASAIIAFVTPYVAAGFGVAYNPLKMAGK